MTTATKPAPAGHPLPFHPLSELFPLLDGKAFDDLAEDIAKNGLREPIWTYQGSILDGRNRYRACERAGITPTSRAYTGDNPVAFVVSLNLHRRHLDESQRAIVAAKIANLPKGTNQHASIEAPTQTEAAELLNVGRASVQRAREVLDRGAPELVQAVQQGVVSVSAASDISTLPKTQQAEIVAQGEEALIEAAKGIRANHRTLGTGDFEWHTPPRYVEAARRVLKEIDLDPASSELANATVGARKYYTLRDDGLSKAWEGRVWLNPPYAQPAIYQFVEKLLAERAAGRVSAAILLTHNYTDTAWFHLGAGAADAICFTRGRISFVSPSKVSAAPTQGQAFFFFGSDLQAFAREFAEIGLIMIPHR